jgi:hypothetical protein
MFVQGLIYVVYKSIYTETNVNLSEHYENKLYCLPYFDLPLLITSFSIFKLFLNSDDQQFQQHQENEQSSLTLNH